MMSLPRLSLQLLALLFALAMTHGQFWHTTEDDTSKWAKCWMNNGCGTWTDPMDTVFKEDPSFEEKVDEGDDPYWWDRAVQEKRYGNAAGSCMFNGDWLFYSEYKWKGRIYQGSGNGTKCINFSWDCITCDGTEWTRRQRIKSFQAVGIHGVNATGMTAFYKENFMGRATYNSKAGDHTSMGWNGVMLWGCEPWTFRNQQDEGKGDCACVYPKPNEDGLCNPIKLATAAEMSKAAGNLSGKIKRISLTCDAGCKGEKKDGLEYVGYGYYG